MTEPFRLAAIVMAGALMGCGVGTIGGGEGKSSADPTPVDLRTVEWNAVKADLGVVDAVTEIDHTSVLFGNRGVTVMSGGVVTTTVAGTTSWTSATTVPAADGTGTWVVGVDATGHLQHVRSGATLEDVNARYGLSDVKIERAVSLAGNRVAFAWIGGFAIADGKNVTRYDDATMKGMTSGAASRIAWVAPGELRAFDVASKKLVRWPLPAAANVTFDASGNLVATTKRGLWIEHDGSLTLRWTANVDFGALVGSGPRVWMVVGTELAIMESETGALSISRGAALPTAETPVRLAGSPSGDVWILHGTTVRRVTPGNSAAAKVDWAATMQPIYARVCSGCHAPGGSAGIDLSSFEGWMVRRESLRKRVVAEKSMPPTTVKVFSDADRDAVKAWLDRNP